MIARQWFALPRLIRFMAHHFMNGAVVGCGLGLLLIWSNTGGIGTLIAAQDDPALEALFFAQSALLSGTAAIGLAVIKLGNSDD